jgi:hypothetical protein
MENYTTEDILTWMQKYKISTSVIEIFKSKTQSKNLIFLNCIFLSK